MTFLLILFEICILLEKFTLYTKLAKVVLEKLFLNNYYDFYDIGVYFANLN